MLVKVLKSKLLLFLDSRQHIEKVLSDSPRLNDFTVGLVDSVFACQNN